MKDVNHFPNLRLTSAIERIDDVPSDEEIYDPSGFQSFQSSRTGHRGSSWNMCDSFFSSSCMTIIKDLVLFSLALFGIFSIFKQPATKVLHMQQKVSGKCECGNSIPEAISLGCKFDPLAMAWLPEHCRDDELTAEFETKGNGPNGTWVYYADTARTMEVSLEEVAAVGGTSRRVHMTTDWHIAHCIVSWRKQNRFWTKFNGKTVELIPDFEAHIEHCAEIIRDPGDGTISGVRLGTTAHHR